ncbi:MAG TPA: S8 family serine peptidase [Solirubrobacterales bacterium]|jgi:subtilisin family serine protease|nr:S8 family serine peptidase [Solirubrobacterales bacterium]
MQDLPAAPVVPPTAPAQYSPDGVIVQWAPGADRADRIEARAGADVTFASDLGNRQFQLVEAKSGQTPGEAVNELEASSAVAVAERDGYRSLDAVPNDPLLGQLWGLANQGLGVGGVTGAVAGDDIDALGAWGLTVGTPATVVADIDSGYRFEHPDLANVAWTNPAEASGIAGVDDDGDGIADDIHGADFVGANGEAPAPDGNPTDDDLVSGGHGVHTAGTIGAQGNNGVGITGVAQDARIMPLRVCSRFPKLEGNRCPTSSIVAAINYAAAKGARVANMSLGGNTFFQTEVNAIAAAKQTLFVIAAGNDGSDNDGGGSAPAGHHYPCDYKPQAQASPAVPGAIDNVVCVAATNQADGLAGFSDWGATSIDLAAPGTETLSAYPFTTQLNADFEVDDLSSAWPATGADGGFERSNEAPLVSFGITDSTAAPIAGSVRETTSAPITVPANGGCRLSQTRRVVISGTEAYRYSVLLNGVEQVSSLPANSPSPGLERRFLDLPAAFKAGGSVQVRFRFSAGAVPSSEGGVWLDDVSLVCSQAVGQASAYGFLQGTSMAAPHVTGTAALLFSLRPGASVEAVRDALLAGVDSAPSLAGKTVTGGRLDAAAALAGLDPPAAPQLTATDPASPAANGLPLIRGSAEAGTTVRIYLGSACEGSPLTTGSAAELASPGIAVSVPAGGTRAYSATAVDTAASASACSNAISYTNTTPLIVITGGEIVVDKLQQQPPSSGSPAATVTPQSAPPPCTVPKLVGMTLAQAKTAVAAAGCRLGAVHKPKPRKGQKTPALVVRSSSPGAGAKLSNGSVALTLGPKPQAHRH